MSAAAAAACRIRAALPPGGGCSPAILPSATARSSAPRWWSAPSPRKTVCEDARRKTQDANDKARKQSDRAQAVNQRHAGAMLLTGNDYRRVGPRCSWLKCNQTAHAVGQGMRGRPTASSAVGNQSPSSPRSGPGGTAPPCLPDHQWQQQRRQSRLLLCCPRTRLPEVPHRDAPHHLLLY